MFAVTLYDAVYLYLKIASEVLEQHSDSSYIKNGTYMYQRAKNYRTKSGEHCSFLIILHSPETYRVHVFDN